MFGQNPIRSAETDPKRLAIQSTFYTIQGEGPYSGMPALFIRLAGCNLACHFCDTEFETMAEIYKDTDALVNTLIATLTKTQRKFVVLTGGEPMRQNLLGLVTRLFESGTELIQIETAGTLWQPELTGFVSTGSVVLVCSPKTPSVHPLIGQLTRHWKYIVAAGETSEADGLPNRGTQMATKDKVQTIFRANPRHNTIWVSPRDDYDPVKNQANQDHARDVCLKFGYRLSLQIHKLIGVE